MRIKQGFIILFLSAMVAVKVQAIPALNVTLTPSKPYVSQQIVYTVRLLMPLVQWLDAEYQPPHVDDALIISLGDTVRYQTMIDDVTYTVEEQRYAIFPQKSGTLTIQPPLFTAMIVDGVAKHMQLKGETKAVDVLPVSARYTDKHWLPAERLIVSEHYETPNKALQPGDTLTRTVTIKATGLPAELLPALSFVSEKEWSAYFDTPVLKNTVDNGMVLGERTQKITYLFAQPGKMTLSSLHLAWFNTHTKTQEVATLPEKTVLIGGVHKESILPAATHVLDAGTVIKKQTSFCSNRLMVIVGYALAGMVCVMISGIAVFYGKRVWCSHRKQTRKCALPPLNPGDE